MKSGTHLSARRPLPIGKRFSAVLLLLLVLLAGFRPGYGAAVFTGPQTGPVLGMGVPVNGGGITFNVQSVNTASPTGPLFDPTTGALTNIAALESATNLAVNVANGKPGSPSAGYGSLGASSAGFPINFDGGIGNPSGALLPSPQIASSHAPGSGFGGLTGGSSSMYTALTPGAIPSASVGTGAGNFFTNPSAVGDTGPTGGTASEVFSRAISTYQVTSLPATKVPGIALAVSGSLGNQGLAGAFVAASLQTTFSFFTSTGAPIASLPTETAAILIVSNGNGPLANFVAAESSNSTFGPFASTYISNAPPPAPSADSFYAAGIMNLPSVTLPLGTYVKIDATLSLVADPPAFLTLDVFPIDLIGLNPDFGAEAFSVPEPSSYIVFGMGALGSLGAFWRSRKSRKTGS